MQFTSTNPQYEYLRKKWSSRHKSIQNKFWEKHGGALKQLTAGSLGGLIMLSSPQILELPSANLTVSKDDVLKNYDQNVLLAQVLSDKVPKEVRPLDLNEEKDIIEILSNNFSFKITAEINNIRLNRNYGLIGGEQHLYRYPGDTILSHTKSATEWAKYGAAGMAPNLGAWGYFASSKEEFTQKDEQREKYYLAIQTFLIPGYAENTEKFRDFFKFRKILIVNPKSGQAVIGVIGDVGPSEWTGKHLGGSPEMMDALGLSEGMRKGAVLYFFIDDPKDEVLLGPVKVRSEV